ncbi:hypothetical protein CLF_109086 [Clonorchis sinensis]|uniref:Uncharacterized protein n=1 Tax=Clonorchis sinensis TaxID=79923 RepID=G7YIY5_CLOSI|nr:hypothetical protein CLF_109086 [Clonorchis sinensis]
MVSPDLRPWKNVRGERDKIIRSNIVGTTAHVGWCRRIRRQTIGKRQLGCTTGISIVERLEQRSCGDQTMYSKRRIIVCRERLCTSGDPGTLVAGCAWIGGSIFDHWIPIDGCFCALRLATSVIIIGSIKSLSNIDASLSNNLDLFESLIIRKRTGVDGEETLC